MKYIEKVREFSKRTPVFDTRSISKLIRDTNYTYVLLNHLLKRGEIRRVTKGYYTVYEDPSLLVYCLKPAYLGLQDAMSLHNLWEQETNPIIVTARKVRSGIRIVFGSIVLIRRVSPRYFFGYEYYKYNDFFLPVSDIEKTFIDMVYFNEITKDSIKPFKNKIEKEKIQGFLKKYDKRFSSKVMSLIS